MTVLITGASGALGSALKKQYPGAFTPARSEMNLADGESVSGYFGEHPDIDTVIHAGALTGIRPCEEDRSLAWRTNVEGTRHVIDAVIRSGTDVQFIYVSTACVFDGHSGMYLESSIPYPENFYALTKLLGEHETRRLGRHLIVRTNFVARTGWPYPRAFSDRFGTYLFADGVAEGISDVQKADLEGTVHIVGDRKMSVLELARITTPDVRPMTIDDYAGPPLTMDMSLDSERWKKYKIK